MFNVHAASTVRRGCALHAPGVSGSRAVHKLDTIYIGHFASTCTYGLNSAPRTLLSVQASAFTEAVVTAATCGCTLVQFLDASVLGNIWAQASANAYAEACLGTFPLQTDSDLKSTSELPTVHSGLRSCHFSFRSIGRASHILH